MSDEEEGQKAQSAQNLRARAFMRDPGNAAMVRSALAAGTAPSAQKPPSIDDARAAVAQMFSGTGPASRSGAKSPRHEQPSAASPSSKPGTAPSENPGDHLPLGYTPERLTPDANDPAYRSALDYVRAAYPRARDAAAPEQKPKTAVEPFAPPAAIPPKDPAPEAVQSEKHFAANIVFKHFNDQCRKLSKKKLFGTSLDKMTANLDLNLGSIGEALPDMHGMLVDTKRLSGDAELAVSKVFSKHFGELRELYKKSNHHNGVFLQKNNGAAFEARLAEVFAECYQTTLTQYAKHAGYAKRVSEPEPARTLSGDIEQIREQTADRAAGVRRFLRRWPATATLATAASLGAAFFGTKALEDRPKPEVIRIESARSAPKPVVAVAPAPAKEERHERTVAAANPSAEESHQKKPALKAKAAEVIPTVITRRTEPEPITAVIPDRVPETTAVDLAAANTVDTTEPALQVAVENRIETNEVSKRYFDRLIQSGKLRLMPSFFKPKEQEVKRQFTTLFPEGVSPAVDAIRSMKPLEPTAILDVPPRPQVSEPLPIPEKKEPRVNDVPVEKLEAPIKVASTPTYYKGAGSQFLSLNLDSNQKDGVLATTQDALAISSEVRDQAKAVFYGNSGIQSLGLNENQTAGVLATSQQVSNSSPTTYGSSGLLSLGLNENQTGGVLKPTQTPSFASKLKGSVSRFFGR